MFSSGEKESKEDKKSKSSFKKLTGYFSKDSSMSSPPLAKSQTHHDKRQSDNSIKKSKAFPGFQGSVQTGKIKTRSSQ